MEGPDYERDEPNPWPDVIVMLIILGVIAYAFFKLMQWVWP